jgi:4-hydroxy-tetrahydrodipicolinate synthase
MAKELNKYSGVIVPMVTPINELGNIDLYYNGKLINFLLDHKVIPFVMGSSGEAPLLSLKARDIMVQQLIANRRLAIPLIAGVIGLSFEDTVNESNKYFNWGLDAVVITLPNYYELTEGQMYDYYLKLSERIKGNIIIYNIPKTVHMSIPVKVINRLSFKKNIVGIKDSENDLDRLRKSLELWGGRLDFKHFVGVNTLMKKGLELGANGIVPSTANIRPALYTKLIELTAAGQYEEAEIIQLKTNEITKCYQSGNTLGESLAMLKGLMSELDLCQPWMLAPLSTQQGEKLVDKLKVINE